MALASLVSQLAIDSSNISAGRETPVRAFIVDHRLRSGSTEDAHKVAAELQRLQINSHILQLDSAVIKQQATSSNLESVLRKLRYRALGAACRDHGIRTLLVAHHADDQAETILTRIVTGYVGFGLAGVQGKAPIPECHGVYGVSQSGDPKIENVNMVVESGGVEISRPFLNVRKSELVDVCNVSGTKWFEDHTNEDPQLTLRNTIRYLQKTNALPVALQPDRLWQMAERTQAQRAALQYEASELMAKLSLDLDVRRGSVSFDATAFQTDETEAPVSAARQKQFGVVALATREVLALVSPKIDIPLQDLDQVVDMITKQNIRPPHTETLSVQVAGVNIHRLSDQGKVRIRRAIPTSRELAEKQTVLYPFQNEYYCGERIWSPWQLWDNRYWIRIAPPLKIVDSAINIRVRFFQEQHLAKARQNPSSEASQAIKLISERAPGKLSKVMPIIVMTRQASDIQETPSSFEEALVLPTLGWSAPAWARVGTRAPREDHRWLWDIRYKCLEQDPRGRTVT